MRTCIFLGAGASAAEGAPIQNDLFRQYFKSLKPARRGRPQGTEQEMQKELAGFFDEMFGINVRNNRLELATFPTFEEALGLLDLAELRREAFKKYELEDFGPNGNRIRKLRKYLVFAMAKVINDTLTKTQGLHDQLIRKLLEHNLFNQTVFVTTNYDILIDNAISRRSQNRAGGNLDYGVEFTNFRRGDWQRPDPNAVPLFKLHGSLNWLYCANDNTLTLTPFEKGVIDLITDVQFDADRAVCRDCQSIMSPIIVPPTFYKDMSRVFLSEIWNKAEQALRDVDHIVFCGYSFPDADMHIKYLLKRVQSNRTNRPPLKFSVVNHHPGKKKQQSDEERARFQRFLGVVNYTRTTFKEFANAPRGFYS